MMDYYTKRPMPLVVMSYNMFNPCSALRARYIAKNSGGTSSIGRLFIPSKNPQNIIESINFFYPRTFRGASIYYCGIRLREGEKPEEVYMKMNSL